MSALPTSQLRLRAMAVGDMAAVMAIEAMAYSHPWSHGNFVDSLAAGHLAEVLEFEGLIGYFVAMAGVDELHLLNLTVAPAVQQQGHGSAMLEALLAHARARRLASVWLEVRASNAGARSLYARRGFSEVGLRRGYYPATVGREDAVVMSRALVPVSVPVPVPASAEQAPNPASTAHGSEDGRRRPDALD